MHVPPRKPLYRESGHGAAVAWSSGKDDLGEAWVPIWESLKNRSIWRYIPSSGGFLEKMLKTELGAALRVAPALDAVPIGGS